MANLFLKEDDERQNTDVHEVVENAAEQAHLEHLRHEKPDDDEDEYAVEDVGRTRLAHQFVDVVEQTGNGQYVDYVYYSKVYHRAG